MFFGGSAAAYSAAVLLFAARIFGVCSINKC